MQDWGGYVIPVIVLCAVGLLFARLFSRTGSNLARHVKGAQELRDGQAQFQTDIVEETRRTNELLERIAKALESMKPPAG